MTDYDFFLSSASDDAPVEGIRAGTIAVWRGTHKTDFSAAIDPLNNLSAVRFHSDFDYLRCDRIVTSRDAGRAAISLGATGSDAVIDRTDILFAHGMSPPPLVISEIEVNGYRQPLAGSMTPLPGGNVALANWRICEIVVDDTNVMLRSRGGYAPAMTIHWRVLLLREAFQVRSEGDFMLYLDAAEIDGAQVGKVDAANKFLIAGEDANAFRVLGGQHTVVASGGQSEASDGNTGWIILNACSAYTNATSWGGWLGTSTVSAYRVEGVEVAL